MKLDHVVVFVSDFDGALAYYRDGLCLAERFREGDIAYLEAGSTGVLLHGDDGEPKPPLPSFEVDQIDKTVARLRDGGIDVPDAIDEGWGRISRFTDPSGNRICIFERNAAAG